MTPYDHWAITSLSNCYDATFVGFAEPLHICRSHRNILCKPLNQVIISADALAPCITMLSVVMTWNIDSFLSSVMRLPVYCIRMIMVSKYNDIKSVYLKNFHYSGLDTYFFLNLAVGQPSNNMDLSEIEIYLGMMIIFFLFRKKKSGRTVYLYIYFLFQDYCVWSTLSHNKQLVFFSSSCVFRISVHFDVTGTRNTFLQGIQKCITLNILTQKVERIRMYSLCSARHVMSCHCCMFTEHYNFNIFGIEWDKNIIITVISDHLSHAQGRWLVYLSFTKFKRRPNVHVTAATAHYHISRAAALVLEI